MKHRFIIEVSVPDNAAPRVSLAKLHPFHIEAAVCAGAVRSLSQELTCQKQEVSIVVEAAPERTTP